MIRKLRDSTCLVYALVMSALTLIGIAILVALTFTVL